MYILNDIQDEKYVHPNINARVARLKICDRIRQAQREWKGAVLSAKMIGKILHQVFNVSAKE